MPFESGPLLTCVKCGPVKDFSFVIVAYFARNRHRRANEGVSIGPISAFVLDCDSLINSILNTEEERERITSTMRVT